MSKITNINIQGTEYDVVDADAREALDVLATAVDGKQATLTAGNGIDITNNTISVDKIQAVTSLPTTSTNGNLVLYKGSSGSIVSYTQIAFDPTDTEHFDYDNDDEVYYFNNGQFFVKIGNEYYPTNIASENNGTIILRMTGEALAEPYDNNLYIENYVELTQGTIYEYNNGSWTAVMSESSGSSVTVDSTLDTTSSNPIANSAVATALNSKQATLTFDSTPTQNSTNPVTSGGVYTALSGKQATLTFDSTPTSASTNPVTSGGVYTALSGKQATLTFDSTPTNGSTNPVTSGGVYTALQNVSGASVELPYTYLINSAATLSAWASNTAGNDYTTVYIAAGSYATSNPLNIDCSTTGTKRIYGAGGEASVIENVQISNGHNISDFTLKNGILYNCSEIHDMIIEWNNLYYTETIPEHYTAGGSWIYALNACSRASNILIKKMYTTYNGDSGYTEIGSLYDSWLINNVRSVYYNGTTKLSCWDIWSNNYNVFGNTAAPEIYNSDAITCCTFNHAGKAAMGVVNGCSNITDSEIVGHTSEYGIISNSNRISNCTIWGFTNTSDSGGAGHPTYLIYSTWQVSNCKFWGYNYAQQSETVSTRLMRVGKDSGMVTNNIFYADSTEVSSTYPVYASGNTNSSYYISDTPSGGFNYIATSSW